MPAPPPPRHPVPDHIPPHLAEAFATAPGSPIRPHCPYQLGAPVQMHGYPGEQPGHRRTGFRGWAVATLGATILTGITEDGHPWAEEWGRLRPAGQPIDRWGGCTCCRAERAALQRAELAHRQAQPEQLDLFAAIP